MTDYIATLPTDKEPLNRQDINILRNIFDVNLDESFASEPPDSQLHSLIGDFKIPIFIGLVFFLFDTSIASFLIKTVVPYASNSPLSLTAVKAGIVTALMFIVFNYSLVKYRG